MRRLGLLLVSLLVLCSAASAQSGTTVVSAQVKDLSGNLYVNCQWSVVFVGQNTTPGAGPYAPAPLLNGQQGNCDSSGNFSVNLADNINTVTPVPSQWNFSICSAGGYVGGPFCKANILITITGATQNISSSLTAVLPLLPSTGTPTAASPLGSLQGNNGGVFGGIPNTTVNFSTGAITTTAPLNINGGGALTGTFTGTPTFPVTGNVALKQFTADNTIYVSTLGNDSNDGLSPGTAKLTLAGALAALPAPGVVGWIKFGAGTFTFNNVTLPAASSNQESLRITGINTNRSAPNGGGAGGTIFSNTSSSNPTIILGPGTVGVTIEGIYFTSSSLGSTTPHIYDNSGTSASGVNAQNYFVNNYFQGGGYGIQINAPSVTGGSNFETFILQSQFNQQTTDCIHVTSALQGQASQLTLRDNRCQLFGVNGFYLTNASGVLIDNNQITSNAGSTGDNIFINAGGGAATTISNNELESLPASNASTHALNLNGGSFSIFNNAIFNTTGAISCLCNNSTIGTNNFGSGSSGAGWDITLNSGSTQNVIMAQAGQYPFGYFKDNSGLATNQMFNIDGTGLNQFANIKVNGCTSGQFVKGDGTGCATSTGAPGTPSSSLQGNNSGAFAGIPNTTANFSTGAITTSASFSATGGGALGGTFSGTPSFSGQLTSTVSTGTAPWVIASTTNVANLNAASVNGNTFPAPGPIGGTTPSTATFTGLTDSALTQCEASGIGSGGVFSASPYLWQADQCSGADLSVKTAAAMTAVNGVNSAGGHVNSRGFSNATTTSVSLWPASTFQGGILDLPAGIITNNVPQVVPVNSTATTASGHWHLRGLNGQGFLGLGSTVLQAHSGTFQVGASGESGTASALGTAGIGQSLTITGATPFSSASVGCVVMAPSGSGLGLAGNSSWAMISSATSSNVAALYYVNKNGTGNAAGSTWDMICPDAATDTGNNANAIFGVGYEDLDFDCGGVTGCIPFMNLNTQELSYVLRSSFSGFTNVGMYIGAQNAAPYEGLNFCPGSGSTANTIPLVDRVVGGSRGEISEVTITKCSAVTVPNIGIDAETLSRSYHDIHIEDMRTAGICFGCKPTLNISVPNLNLNAHSASARNINCGGGSGGAGTCIELGNNGGGGGQKAINVENVDTTSSWTNALVDIGNSNTLTQANNNFLGFYSTDGAGGVFSNANVADTGLTGLFAYANNLNALNAGTTEFLLNGTTGAVQFVTTQIKPIKTVATLPTCNAGAEGTWSAVSDATGPTYNATLTGGGTVHVPVYCNGTAWTSH